MESENRGTAFTEGEIYRPLLKFTLPVLFALLLQAMYGAVDLAVVGQFGDTSEVAAVSTGSQIMQTVAVVIAGLSMGSTIIIGQRLGSGDKSGAGRAIGCAVCLFGALALISTPIMELTAPAFTALMKTPESAVASTIGYVRVCSGGMVFIVAYNLLGSVFRGIGDSRTPLLAVVYACVLNIGGDLFCVAVLKLGAVGAAIATVVSQAVSVLLCLFSIKRRPLPISFDRSMLRFDRRLIALTLKLGVPVSLQDLLVSISFLVLLAIVNSLGATVSAGVGVAEKICGFVMLIPSAFSQSLSAFTAQNVGAGKPQRARRGMLYGMLTSFGIAVAIFYLSFFHGDLLARVFSHDAEVIADAADYLKAYAIDTMLTSFLFCFCGYFSGCGHTRFVMVQGIIGAFGVRIPVAYAMSRRRPVSLFGIAAATPCSTLVQITLCAVYLAISSKHETMPASLEGDTHKKEQ